MSFQLDLHHPSCGATLCRDAEDAGDALEAAVEAATAQAEERIAALEQQLAVARSTAAAAQEQVPPRTLKPDINFPTP